MEFDGNIRYANYQDEQGVIDYLTANGFGEETYSSWFGGSGERQTAAAPASTVPAASAAMWQPQEMGFVAEIYG